LHNCLSFRPKQSGEPESIVFSTVDSRLRGNDSKLFRNATCLIINVRQLGRFHLKQIGVPVFNKFPIFPVKRKQ
jgi:hypothetical protein